MPRLQRRPGACTFYHAAPRELALTDSAFVTQWSVGFGVPGGAWTAWGLLLAMGAVVALNVWHLRNATPPRRRWLMVALRALTGLALWSIAVQPTWFGRRTQVVHGRLALLIDASRSMGVTDGESSRADRTSALLQRWSKEMPEGGVQVHLFGQELRATSLERLRSGLPAEDDQSRLAESIEQLTHDDRDLGAIVVVSDGAESVTDREPEAPGVKIHSISAAEPGPFRDDTIVSVQADPVAFLRQPARVRVTVRSTGGAASPIPVSLHRGEELVREEMATPDESGEGSVEIPFTPRKIGRAVYRLSIPVTPHDTVPENNERAFLVEVTRDKLRVLLLAGRPSWDERFLRSFLKRDPSIDLISFFILRTATDLTMATPDELALIPFPTDELFSEHLHSFDLVIFQNFDFGPYQMAGYLPRIRDYVLGGGSFAMIGGDLSFASGRYAETPIAEVLPVTIPSGTAPLSARVVAGRFHPQPVQALSRHPILRLLPNATANSRAWGSLAALEGANAILDVQGDGRTLLTHPRKRTQAGAPMPILTIGHAGQGRTLAFATDTSWRWGIATAGVTGDASVYERFWDHTLRWLTRDPSLEPARVTTDRKRYGRRAKVAIQARLRDDRYVPYADRKVRLSVFDAAGREVAGVDAEADGRGRARASISAPSESGGYRVTARLADEAEPLCEEAFVVEQGGDELADPRPRADRLQAYAKASGGTFHTLARAPALTEFDRSRSRALGVTRRAPLATAWAFFAVVLLCGAEWLWRRRWGQR